MNSVNIQIQITLTHHDTTNVVCMYSIIVVCAELFRMCARLTMYRQSKRYSSIGGNKTITLGRGISGIYIENYYKQGRDR